MDKFEKHIKSALEQRKIAPSANAWDKISAQLEPEEKPEKKGWYWWSAAAAAIVIILVSTLFIQKEDGIDTPPSPVVIKDKKTAKPDVDTTTEPALKQFEKLPIQGTPTSQAVAQETGKKEVVPATSREEARNRVPETFELPVEEYAVITETAIDKKVSTIVKEVMDLEGKNIQVTDAEIEDLLLKAQGELLMERVVEKNGSVDAMALLTEVEDELDRTVRGQLFEKLKDSYFKVRVAMADRNK